MENEENGGNSLRALIKIRRIVNEKSMKMLGLAVLRVAHIYDCIFVRV